MGNFFQPPPPYYSPQPYYSPAPTFSPPPTQPSYVYGYQPMDMSYTGIMGDSYYSNPAAAQPYTPVNYGKLGSYPMAPSQFQPYSPPGFNVMPQQTIGDEGFSFVPDHLNTETSGFRPGETAGAQAVLAPIARPGVGTPEFTLEQLKANAPMTPSATPAIVTGKP